MTKPYPVALWIGLLLGLLLGLVDGLGNENKA